MGRTAMWRLLLPLSCALLVWAEDPPMEGLTAEDERRFALQMAELYGGDGLERFEQWRQLVGSARQLSETEKLEQVNRFFNRQTFVDDAVLWQQQDYWATVPEFLGAGGGDCEDFAISKFFTLRELGVSEEKLRITYVKALKLNQFHMVLAYYPTADAEPLILDNLESEIRRAGKRRDLQPIYSFNGDSLWLAKSQGSGQRVGGSDKLSSWQSLRQRLLNLQWRVPPGFQAAPPAATTLSHYSTVTDSTPSPAPVVTPVAGDGGQQAAALPAIQPQPTEGQATNNSEVGGAVPTATDVTTGKQEQSSAETSAEGQ